MLKRFLFSPWPLSGIEAQVAWLGFRMFIGLAISLAHGLKKFPPPEMLIQAVGGMGFPSPELFAWAATLSELAGGILIALGLLTRPAALAVAFTMATAALGQHAADPFSVKEMAFLYLVSSLLILFTGAGRYSADALIKK